MQSTETPVLSIRYFLNLAESQDGFTMATFGKKPITQFLTPLISVVLIIWGVYLINTGSAVGRYYIALGAGFLLLQVLMRVWILPWLFKRQYVRHQFGQTEQGLELYQDHMIFYAAGRSKKVPYSDIKQFRAGKLSYMVVLSNHTVVVVPKRAMDNAQQQLFLQAMKR